MNDADGSNPYSTPEADVQDVGMRPGNLKDLDWKRLRKMYLRSCNVSCINFLVLLGALVLGAASLGLALPGLETGDSDGLSTFSIIFGVIALFYIVTFITLYKRSRFGRVCGIICCLFMLINPPFGTIIGIAGLFAFFKAPELFGDDRFTHKTLKAEYKYRKKNKLKD